jgi:effector-binding domain-containing protein
MFKIGFQTERSTIIKKPVEEVYPIVADFNTWQKWSPWICQEPDCPVNIKGQPGEVGHYQEWNGKRIGTGNMKLTRVNYNKRLDYELSFVKPWKSTAKVVFEFQNHGKGIEVVWRMEGTLPFFLFFMRKKMSAWVGSDYQRGLSMLKDELETGEVLSNSDFQDVVEKEPFYYAGIRTRCKMDEIGQSMKGDFEALANHLENGKLPQPDSVAALYIQFDFITQDVDYVSAFMYKQKPKLDQDADYEIGSAPGHKALKVVHTGAYKHLGNAWSTAMGARMAHKLRINKKIPMYEVYENDPCEVDDKDLLTSIYAPIR